MIYLKTLVLIFSAISIFLAGRIDGIRETQKQCPLVEKVRSLEEGYIHIHKLFSNIVKKSERG